MKPSAQLVPPPAQHRLVSGAGCVQQLAALDRVPWRATDDCSSSQAHARVAYIGGCESQSPNVSAVIYACEAQRLHISPGSSTKKQSVLAGHAELAWQHQLAQQLAHPACDW